tara:strand:+ start:356 stop:544 length:189 start_codon:yes stop_codon:yes gene_type:complete
MKLLNYFTDGYNMENEYSTEQLIKFSEDIYDEWEKSNIIESLNDVCEIERELVKREYNINEK